MSLSSLLCSAEEHSRLPYPIGEVYNVVRLHSILSYHSPNEFQELFVAEQMQC